MIRTRGALALLAALALGLSGCGGGGGGAPATEATSAEASPSEAASSESQPSEPAATSESESTAAAPAPAGEHTIVAMTVMFNPTSLTVPAGTTVTWANEETLPVPHTVTAGTPDAPSGMFDLELPQGESVTFTFDQAGSYPFFCNIHRTMTGEIVVQ